MKFSLEWLKYFLETDPRRAQEKLEARKSRYVLVSPMLSELALMLKHTEEPLESFIGQSPDGAPLITALWSQTMNTRLHHFDGRRVMIEGRPHPPLRRMRLVYEGQTRTRELGKDLSYCKIFERVQGANLTGSANPGSTLELSVTVHTNLGRRYNYRDSTVVDKEGRFHFRVPYATGGNPDGVKVGQYTITSGDGVSQSISIPEPQILEGTTITIQGLEPS